MVLRWIQLCQFSTLILLQNSQKRERFAMKVIIHLTSEEEVKALPILLRHSPGIVLPHRTYVLSEDALMALRRAGVRFSELSREAATPNLEELAGQRV